MLIGALFLERCRGRVNLLLGGTLSLVAFEELWGIEVEFWMLTHRLGSEVELKSP